MSDDAVAVTKDGIRLSYGRFLADSAGGYVLLLAVGYVIWATGDNSPRLGGSFTEAKPAVIILAGVFILLLGPPFGLALNGVTWFLLGWIQVMFVNYWARNPRFNHMINVLTRGTGNEFSVPVLQRTFLFLDPQSTSDHQLFSQVHLLQRLMQTRFPAAVRRVDYLNGIKIFIRNLSLITFVLAFYLPRIGFALAATLVLTLLACALELYRTLEVVYSAYAICLMSDLTNVQRNLLTPVPMTFGACVETLLATRPESPQDDLVAPEAG